MGLRELMARWRQKPRPPQGVDDGGGVRTPVHAYWTGRLCEMYPELHAAADEVPDKQACAGLLQRLGELIAAASRGEDVGAGLRWLADELSVDLPTGTRQPTGASLPLSGIPIYGQSMIEAYPCPAGLCRRRAVPQPGKVVVCHVSGVRFGSGQR